MRFIKRRRGRKLAIKTVFNTNRATSCMQRPQTSPLKCQQLLSARGYRADQRYATVIQIRQPWCKISRTHDTHNFGIVFLNIQLSSALIAEICVALRVDMQNIADSTHQAGPSLLRLRHNALASQNTKPVPSTSVPRTSK